MNADPEQERNEEELQFNEAYADVESALADVPKDNPKAEIQRCCEIADAIHNGTF